MSEVSTRSETARQGAAEFQREADRASHGIVWELVDFLRHNKKWWLTPILLGLFLIGALVLLSATGAGPFIYTLF
jgi:hypothetical protein